MIEDHIKYTKHIPCTVTLMQIFSNRQEERETLFQPAKHFLFCLLGKPRWTCNPSWMHSSLQLTLVANLALGLTVFTHTHLCPHHYWNARTLAHHYLIKVMREEESGFANIQKLALNLLPRSTTRLTFIHPEVAKALVSNISLTLRQALVR